MRSGELSDIRIFLSFWFFRSESQLLGVGLLNGSESHRLDILLNEWGAGSIIIRLPQILVLHKFGHPFRIQDPALYFGDLLINNIHILTVHLFHLLPLLPQFLPILFRTIIFLLASACVGFPISKLLPSVGLPECLPFLICVHLWTNSFFRVVVLILLMLHFFLTKVFCRGFLLSF